MVGVRVRPQKYVFGQQGSTVCASTLAATNLLQVVLFALPNADDLGTLFRRPHSHAHYIASALGVALYVFDYSGYGRSTGTPSEANSYADIRAVYAHILQSRKNVKARCLQPTVLTTQPSLQIVLMGMSIGTAVVVDLAGEQPPRLAGVVLLAPLTSGCRYLCNVPERPQALCCDSFLR